MKEYTQEEITLIRYGLALVAQETCGKIHNVKNKANNLKILSEYKSQLIKILELDDKIKEVF